MGECQVLHGVHDKVTLGIEMAQSREWLRTLGPKRSIVYILGFPGLKASLNQTGVPRTFHGGKPQPLPHPAYYRNLVCSSSVAVLPAFQTRKVFVTAPIFSRLGKCTS